MAVDLRVLEAQEWVNDTYRGKPGFVDAPENGQTGWSTMYALTRALQIELGVAPPSNAFGPGTTAAVSAISPIATGSGAPVNVVKILQCAMWCKGYSAGNIDGDFGALLTAAVRNVQTDLGVASRPGFGTVDAKLFRTLLTMDAYIRVGAGTVEIRSIQQWLNATYIGRLNFQYLPTDGRFSRGVQTGLLYALQFELGLNDATANGAFGPTTRALLSARPPLVVGTVDGVTKFVHLFQAALTFNGYPVFFDGNFGPASSTETSTFQDFAALQVTGTGNYQTWAELLVSTGDPTRPVTAIDTATPLILASQPDNDTIDAAPMAASLVAQGYTIAGRYLVNAPGGTLDKRMRVDELAMVSAAGMGVVPFFQTTGSASSYFTRARGLTDGATAIEAARALGFGNSTIIYFAVDFDATDDQIASNVVPYFEGVRDALAGSEFRLGAYGTRNVCTTLSDLALATASYVAGLSSGWSGNLGFPLPRDWAFNQIQETTASVSNGTGIVSLGLDRVASSGRSDGARVSQAFTRSLARLQALANSWSASTGQDPSALMSYPFRQGRYEGLNWGLLAGPVDDSFVDDARAQMVEPGSWPLALRYDDPGGSKAAYSPHLMATLGALVHQGMPPLPGVVTLADVGGWLGDLWTATGEYLRQSRENGLPQTYQAAYDWAFTRIGQAPGSAPGLAASFDRLDLHQDLDAFNARGRQVDTGSDVAAAVAWALQTVNVNGLAWRYEAFIVRRFGSSTITMSNAMSMAMTLSPDTPENLALSAARMELIREGADRDYSYSDLTEGEARGIGHGLSAIIASRAGRNPVP